MKAWLKTFIEDGRRGRGVASWEIPMFDACCQMLGLALTSELMSDAAAAETRVALRSRGIDLQLSQEQFEADQERILTAAKLADTGVNDIRAVIRLAALDWVYRTAPIIRPSHATVRDVVDLLKRVPAGLRRWTWESKPKTSAKAAEARRWHVDNEYHVQNLLWFLLAPMFPELVDEEYVPSVGQLQPRLDLAIPSLRLIVEVKFLRSGKPMGRLIEEIGADANLYLGRSDRFTQILPFIWDDSRRTHEHDMLLAGINKLPGIVDSVVVSRPGTFLQGSSSTDADKIV
jgi:hypothetical protein